MWAHLGKKDQRGQQVYTCYFLYLVLARLDHGALFSLHIRFLAATKWSWSKNLYRIMGWEDRRKRCNIEVFLQLILIHSILVSLAAPIHSQPPNTETQIYAPTRYLSPVSRRGSLHVCIAFSGSSTFFFILWPLQHQVQRKRPVSLLNHHFTAFYFSKCNWFSEPPEPKGYREK